MKCWLSWGGSGKLVRPQEVFQSSVPKKCSQRVFQRCACRSCRDGCCCSKEFQRVYGTTVGARYTCKAANLIAGICILHSRAQALRSRFVYVNSFQSGGVELF